jgi:hypothetical protein
MGGEAMLFIARYDIAPSFRKAAIERFMKTGAAPPPGIKMVGRWHSADGAFGFTIAESDDIQAMAKWNLAWNDLLTLDIRPALDDQGLGQALAAMQS